MRKTAHRSVILLALCSISIALSVLAARRQAVAIPDAITSAVPNARPVWVAAAVAFDDSGALRPELFDAAAISALDAYREAERAAQRSSPRPRDCRVVLNGTGPEIRVAIDGVDDLTRNSRAVVRGDVVSSREGFYFGLPGTLFAVQVSARLKDVGGVSKSSVLYIFVDSARIDTRSGFICAKPSAPGAVTPSVGDQVIIFAVFDSPDATHAIVPVNLTRTIVVQHDDRLHVPHALQSMGNRTIDDVLSRLRKSAGLREMPAQWGAQ